MWRNTSRFNVADKNATSLDETNEERNSLAVVSNAKQGQHISEAVYC